MDPIGTTRVELYLARLTAELVNFSPISKRHNLGIDDFLLRFEPRVRKSPEDVAAAFRGYAKRMRIPIDG